MEKNNKLLTPAFIDKLKKLKSEQVIFGEPDHPKRLPHKVDRPEYTRPFSPEPQPMCQICCCIEGKCVITINDVSFQLLPGDLCFIRRNVSHYESYFKPDQAYKLIWLNIREEIRMHQSVYIKQDGFYTMNHQRIRVTKESVRQLDKIYLLRFDRKKGRWPLIKDMIIELFSYYQKQDVVIRDRIQNKWQVKLVNDLRNYIKEHYNEKICLKEVAARLSYSQSYLNSLFRKEMGEGIIQYSIRWRLFRASLLLESSHLNIAQIARECGYDDESYFTRLFKKMFAISPTEYRKMFSNPS